MKSTYILVSYLLLSLTSVHANVQSLAKEFLQSNFDLKKAETQLEVSELGLQIEESKYNWNLQASSSVNDTKLSTLNPFAIATIESNIHSLAFSKSFDFGGTLSLTNSLEQHLFQGRNRAGFSQTLAYSQQLGGNLFGRQSKNALAVAQDNIEVARVTVEGSKEQMLYGFASGYVKASLLKSLLDYQAQAYQRAVKRKNLIKRRVRDGLREKVDLYQADNALLQSEEELISAENNLNDVLQMLSESLHRSVSKDEIEYLSFKEMMLPKGSIDANLNLQTLREKRKVISKELESADYALFPTVKLDTSYMSNDYENNVSDAIAEGLLGGANRELKAALSLTWNIGRESEKAQYAMKRVEDMTLAKEIESEQKNLLIMDKVVLDKIKNLAQIIQSSQKRINLAQKTLKEYNSLYNKGRVDLDTVIRAEESLINTQRSYSSHVSSHRELVYSLSLLYGDLEKYLMR